MANRFPLILNGTQIQEIANGDSLDLSGNSIVNATGITTAALTINGQAFSSYIPTALSDLTNDIGLTVSYDWSNIINAPAVSTDNGSVRISDAYNLPQGDGATGQILASDGNGNLYWSDSLNTSDLSVGSIKFNDEVASNDEVYIRTRNNTLFFARQNRLLIGTENQQNTTGVLSSGALYIAGDIWGSRQDGTPDSGWKYKRIHLGGRVEPNSDLNAVPILDPTEFYWFESIWAKEGNLQTLKLGGTDAYSTDSYEFPTSDGAAGQALTTDGNGTLQWSNVLTSIPATREWSTITSTPTTLAGYGITDAFDGAYSSLTGAPSTPATLTDLGIVDGTFGQFLMTDGAGQFTFETVPSGGTSYDQSLNTTSDVTFNSVTSANFISGGVGTPAFESATTINLITDNLSTSQTWTFGTDGSLTFPDSSIQTGAAISIADLKTLVAASTDFADFQSRIAAL